LRDFRDRDDVTPERLLTLRDGASAITSLSISAGLRRVVVPPCFLEGFDLAASLAEERLVRVDRFPVLSLSSSSSSSVSSSGTTSAFALPLPLLLLVPVSATTVVLVEDADEEERARLELPPAAETAVDDPEENEGDLSRVRRTEERKDAELACTFLPEASLLRPRDVPARATSSFAGEWDSGGREEVIVRGLGVTSAFPWVSCEDDVVDLLCDSSDGPALLFIDASDGSSTTELFASDPFSLSSGFDVLCFLRGGSGTSECSLVLSSWRSACTGLRFRSERRVGRRG